jgi:Ca2+-binding RTX toxin-like protein
MPIFNGTDGNETIIGTAEDDTFNASRGQDVLSGAAGLDTLIADFTAATGGNTGGNFSVDEFGLKGTLRGGELGVPPFWWTEFFAFEHIQFRTGATNDYFYLDFGRTIAAYTIDIDGGAGFDTVDLNLSLGQHAAVTGDAATGIGNSSLIFRNIEQFYLRLGSGNDDVTLAGGNDTIEAGEGNDRVVAMGGDDRIEGQWGGDYLDGGDGNDQIYAYDDYIAVDDGSEIDTLKGGAGNDLLSFGWGDSADGGSGIDRLSISLRSATAGVVLDLSALFAGATITIGGGTITGFEAYDLVYGSQFADTIITGDAPNVGSFLQTGIQGFGGDDSITTGNRADTVSGGAGNDTLRTGGDKDLVSGDEGNDIIYGDAGDDTIYGGEGNDEIHGGADNDLIAGDLTSAFSGIDRLYGDAGNDSLNGGPGADYLDGGAGNDTLILEDGDTLVEAVGGGNDIVNVGFTFFPHDTIAVLSPGAEIETFSAGGSYPSIYITLIGNEFGQTLIGHSGANTLDGAGGADVMIGGAGNDIYIVDIAGDVVTENAGEGIDEIRTALASYSIAALPNVENLTGTSGSAQILTGNGGSNAIRSGGGNDSLIGGAGNDSYYVNNAGDSVIEAAGQGRDRVYASIDYALGAGQHVEILSTDDDAGTAPIALRGNDLANTIYGNAGANSLYGGDGADRLDGGAGDDRLEGGRGGDVLTGGAGADIFVFASPADLSEFVYRSDGAKFAPDTITDFTAGQDRIDLAGIDAVAATAGNDAFTFIGSNAFSGHAGELRVEMQNGRALILGDVNGDGVADLSIVAVTPAIQASDFVL